MIYLYKNLIYINIINLNAKILNSRKMILIKFEISIIIESENLCPKIIKGNMSCFVWKNWNSLK